MEKLKIYKIRYKVQHGSVEELCDNAEMRALAKEHTGKVYKIWNVITNEVYFTKKKSKRKLKGKRRN